MAEKPLVIDTEKNCQAPSDLNKWRFLEQQEKFINSIETPSIDSETADVGSVVSGIPTVFARVNMFRSAISAVTNNLVKEESNLGKTYNIIVDEWKGLLSAIAIDHAIISVRRINMKYSVDEKDPRFNLYEPKGSFGQMLMEGRAKWCNQTLGDPLSDVPFIDVIRYDGQVVGGTSPDTMLFTSIGYEFATDFIDQGNRTWISKSSGRFTDPVKNGIKKEQLRTLYAYVNYLMSTISKVEDYYHKSPLNADGELDTDYTVLRNFLGDWRKSMIRYAAQQEWNILDSVVPSVNCFALEGEENAPYNIFFNYQSQVYIIDSVCKSDAFPGAIAVDPQDLLLTDDCQIARLDIDEDMETTLPVYVMKATILGDDEKAYFALPISTIGLKAFGKNLGALVGAPGAGISIDSSLTATFDPNKTEQNLIVELRLVMSDTGTYTNVQRAYNIKSSNMIRRKDILIWPNFISRQWDRYFLFSELPHNVQDRNYPYRAYPFAGDPDADFQIITDTDGNPKRIAEDGEVVVDKEVIDTKLLVVADNRIADKNYKYEIYESNKPFKGVELLTGSNKPGGYLMIRYTTDTNSVFPKDRLSDGMKALTEVNLGIDFGSTNTSVAYYDAHGENAQAQGFTFRNMRVSLFGNNKANAFAATPNQLFFFPNTELESNAIKSILTLHERNRMKSGANTVTLEEMYGTEVLGGFPCFVRNLPIENIDGAKINVKFEGCGNVQLISDMKWTDSAEDKAHKKAFLRTLMLQIYAQLFRNGMVPTSLCWSYPSSMSNNLCLQYQNIWDSLRDLHPVLNPGVTVGAGRYYDLKVSRYNPIIGKIQEAAHTAQQSSAVHTPGTPNPVSGDYFGTPSAEPVQPAQPVVTPAPAAGGWGARPGSTPAPAPTPQPVNNGWASKNPTAPRPTVGATWTREDENEPVRYNPQVLSQIGADNALPEACAVANYISTSNANVFANDTITLCFDIGGSTTDITAVCQLRTAGSALTMIKQNSIRFAAQMVAGATKYSPNFRQVLLSICNKFNLQIEGLSAGQNSKFTHETAPFYFEQIVDRLKPDQLLEFYRELVANCQELMCVNLYVTGMIMFYAGQITSKLAQQLVRSGESMLAPGYLPKANIVFAGKGARLFEWWSTTNHEAANEYYMDMFILGLGGMEKAQTILGGWPTINLSGTVNNQVKYEVSKGLACSNTQLCIPTDNRAVEIIGEDGFARLDPNMERQPLPFNHRLTPEMMADFNMNFIWNSDSLGPIKCPQFASFCGQYHHTANTLFALKLTKNDFLNAFNNMNIPGYVINLPEYRNAQTMRRSNPTAPFNFVTPFIILEGNKFFDEVLMPSIAK